MADEHKLDPQTPEAEAPGEVEVGAADEAIRPMREGMELTLKAFHDTLKRYQVEALDPHGEPFNPEQHQAMAMQPSASVEPGSVLKVFQKGYLLNGRLLRPAMVVVSKAE